MNTTQFTEVNEKTAQKFLEAWGYEGAKYFITKTAMRQRMIGDTALATVWEANLLALESLKK
jgi:hypothetical protein